MDRFQKTFLFFFAALSLAVVPAVRAETVLWLENFAADAGANWTTNSVWKIGSPATGPATNAAGYRAYSGSQCATTGLKGNAAANSDSRFICTNYNGQPYLAIPGAASYPRLRFWQWFNFVNALGFVEVQAQGSTNWQTVSATNISVGSTASAGGGVWTRPAIDLRAFAGTNVQVAFHFISGSSGYGNDLGWYVDDVALVTGQPVFNNPEGFEAGLGDWAVDAGTWQAGIPTSGPATNAAGARAHSGTNCAATVLATNYGWNVDSRLISPPFTVPLSNSPALHFWQWYKFVNALGFVEVSSSEVLTNLSYTTNYLTATNVDADTNIFYVTNLYAPPEIYLQTNVVTFTNLDTDTFIYNATNSGSTYLQTNTLAFTNVNTGTNIFIVTNNLGQVYLQTNVAVFTNLNQFPAFITTNGTLATNAWQTVSPTVISVGSTVVSNGGWTPATCDLSAFAGQTLQAAFHFQSGGGGFGNAPGWYVDDVSIVTLPALTVPAAMTITAGQTFSAPATATNSLEPGESFVFGLASASTNAFITTNGVLNWTNTSPAIGTVTLNVTATATNTVSVTNSFTVTVQPAYHFFISNAPAGGKFFRLSLHSLTNTAWRIDASTNLQTWQPVLTNTTSASGFLLFTDLLATNFPERFYRAAFQ